MVPGLVVVPDFVTAAEEAAIVAWFGVDTRSRRRGGPRDRSRIDRYGPGVPHTCYVSGDIHPAVPQILELLAARLVERGLVPAHEHPNAITVNQYLPGQTLGYHTDVPTAGRVISTLGLVGDAVLSLQRTSDELRVDLTHEPRMLIQLTGECRSRAWRHAILPVDQHRLSVVLRRGDAPG